MAGNPILRYFEFDHLSNELQPISRAVGDLAYLMDQMLAESAEKSAGLRKLLEAKDCFVRAAIPNHTEEPPRRVIQDNPQA